MERKSKKPPSDGFESIFPVIKPQDAVKMYLTSKQIQRELKKPLDFENARDCVSLDLIKSKRNLRLIEEKLKFSRENEKITREKLNGQWENLKKDQEGLKKLFVDFEKFVVENDQKRSRAQKNVQFQKGNKIHDEDFETIKNEMEKLRNLRKMIGEKIKDYLIYENFLNEVVNKDENLKSINELMERYAALIVTKQTLSKKHENNLFEIEKLRKNTLDSLKIKTSHLTGLRNKLRDLEVRHRAAIKETLNKEKILDEIRENTTGFALELGVVKTSIAQVYHDICKRRKIEVNLKPDDFKNQLEFVKNHLKRFENVVKTANLHWENENVSV